MSGRDAAAVILLGLAGYLALQARPAAAAPATGISQEQAQEIGKGATNAFYSGLGLLAWPGTTAAADVPPQPVPADLAQAGSSAVTAALAGAGLFAYSTALGGDTMTQQTKAGYMPPAQVKSLAQRVITAHGLKVNPAVAAAIAIVESGSVGNPAYGCNPNARRYEPHKGEASAGLMQVLPSTAAWLAKDMGYKAKGIPTEQSLYTPETGMYFGCAYLDYMSRYRGVARDMGFIVQGYNAGPGNTSGAYYQKFLQALAWVQQNLGA